MAKYAYEPEVMSAGVEYVVPSYATIDEAYFFLQEATENNWNNFMKELGLYELGILEATGSEVIYEANGDANEKKTNGVVNAITKALEAFKGWLEDILEGIRTQMNNAKEKLTNSVLKKVKANLDADKLANRNKKGEVINYSNNYHEFEDLESYRSDRFSSAMSGKNVDKLTGVASGSKEVISIGSLRGNKVETVDAAYVSSHYETIVKYALDFNFTKKSIVGPYSELKKKYDQLIKDAKAGNGDLAEAKADLTLLNKNATTVVKAFHERQRENLALLLKVSVAMLGKKGKKTANAKGKETSTGESAIIESYSSEIEKLFDWNF